MKTAVIIPAGGSGKRMGGRIRKQFLKIGKKTVLEMTLESFQAEKQIHEIVLVLPEKRLKEGFRLIRGFPKISAVVPGGSMRTQSVIRGFQALICQPQQVLIHDAVRPFVDSALIRRTISALRKYPAVTAAVPVKDTIKIVQKDKILGTPNRTTLWHTQTPQGFQYEALKKCLAYAEKKESWDTDECQLAEKLGMDVRVVMGSYLNFKITTPEDLFFSKAMIKG
ncbi:MAG: 2-C-methyl-D-erythritol 4-phosphate cytidylyltransferase [Elusimicrobia bacterium RIFOXYB2_FULL_49_7]|nr:MAG: 2-C-methyl-D-erythritol 4-phosphate cytidylyltransferase [Elusimicrobia bacterium RIFOXYB2_FULL_49_7]